MGQGIRIPKPFLEQAGIIGDVELEVDQNQIIIHPVLNPRAGWDDAFIAMAEANDEVLLDGEASLTHSWDDEEWQW